MKFFSKLIILILLLILLVDLLDSKSDKKDEKKGKDKNKKKKDSSKKKDKKNDKKGGKKKATNVVIPSNEFSTTPSTTTEFKPEIKPNRNAIEFPVYWCIYVKDGESMNPFRMVNKTLVEQAMQQLQERTCVEFYYSKECTHPLSQNHYLIRFINDLKTYINEYNFTYPPKLTNPYDIKIQSSCNRQVGCFLKKILAFLDYLLTHRRQDRDKYINVSINNVLTDYREEFDKMENVSVYDTGYDYGSVMHISKYYRKNYSVPNDTFTIQPKSYEYMVGQEYGMSFTDHKFLNNRYCSDLCLNKLKCENGGFQSPEGCEYCECPNGFTGLYCEKIEDSPPECGNTHLNATAKMEKFLLEGRKKCNILITANKEKKIKITVKKALLASSNPCFEKKGLEIKHREDKSLTGLCLCTFAEEVEVESQNNEVFIQYNGQSPNHMAEIEYQEIN